MVKHPILIALLASLLCAQLTGCAKNPFSAHKISIQQGNFITQDMVDKLKPGMTRDQVLYVLGTPLLVSTFNADKWSYVYYLRFGNGQTLRKTLDIVFVDDALAEINGDYKPGATAAETVPTATTDQTDATAEPSNALETPAPSSASSDDIARR